MPRTFTVAALILVVSVLGAVDAGSSSGTAYYISASSGERASGFPRMIRAAEGRVLVAWTDVSGEAPKVRVTAVDLEVS